MYISKYLSYMCFSKNTSGIYLGYYNNLNLTKEMNKNNVIIYQIYKKKKTDETQIIILLFKKQMMMRCHIYLF